MVKDVQLQCQQCIVCQQAKLLNPVKVPMCNIPIGKRWEKQVADIWKVPASHKNDQYLLVVKVMEYFPSEWRLHLTRTKLLH